jgi:hypothetical protein
MEKLKDILIPRKTKFEKIRFGKNGDGGYIFAKTEPKGQPIFGFGVLNDISCEIALNSYFGGKVELFESEETSVHLPDNFILHKKFVNGNDMSDIFKSDENIIIKMDIEGSEFGCLDSISHDEFEKVEQMVVEFHLNTSHLTKDMPIVGSPEDLYRVIQKILKTHKIFHIHGNSCCGVSEDGIPVVLELSFINKKLCDIDLVDDSSYPIPGLDFPNVGGQDVYFKWW